MRCSAHQDRWYVLRTTLNGEPVLILLGTVVFPRVVVRLCTLDAPCCFLSLCLTAWCCPRVSTLSATSCDSSEFGSSKIVNHLINNTTQHHTTPHHTTPHHTTPHHTTPHHTTPHHTTPHHTTQRNATQHNTTQHNTTQHNTTQHNTTQHNTTQPTMILQMAFSKKKTAISFMSVI